MQLGAGEATGALSMLSIHGPVAMNTACMLSIHSPDVLVSIFISKTIITFEALCALGIARYS